MKLALAFVAALSIAGAAHSQQFKVHPVQSYVLTDPDGTPRYLVQYSEASNSRRVYYINTNAAQPANSTAPKRPENKRRPAPKKRTYWPTEIM
jgi:hypothetical protein